MTRDGMIAGLIAFLSAWAQAEMVSWTLPSDWERGVDYAETGGRLEPRKAAFGRPVSPIGSPSLPFVTAELPVPRDATLTACSVEAEWEAVETALRPAIVQAPRVIGERPVPTAEDPAHFGAEAFPSEAATATEQTFSGQAVFLVRATPYRWNGAKGTLEKARRLVVTCTYALPRGVRRAVRAAPPGRIDMVIVSPPAFTNLWPAYVAYRRETHPGLNVVVKNTAEIYADYEGADDALKIHKYLEDLYANNGLRYAILGAGSQKRAYDAEREIPTRHVYAYGGVGKASDLYYSCMEKKGGAEVWDFDGDGVYLGSRKPGGGYAGEDGWKTDWTPDIACFRFPLREEGTVVGRVSKVKRTYAAGEQMDGLIAKLRRVESADGSFAGDFKAGYSGHRLFGALGRGRRDEYLTGESQFYDGGLNPWRAAHDSPVDDWEFITRWQVRNYIARNRPLTGVYCGRDGSPAGIYGNDLEMNVHASHGQPQTAAPFEAFDFFTTTHIQKVLNFCHSCETGHLDTDSYGGYGNLCFAEASVLNPHGGALATMNSTRVSYAGGVEYHEDYVLLIQACMNEAFFSLGDGSAAEAFVRGHNRIVQRLGGALNPADPMGHCYVVMNMMGDPLVRMARPGPDASCAGVLAGPCVTNATLTADVAVAADVGVMSLAVRPAAPGSAVTVGGAKTLKAFSRLTVENGSLEWNAPGGVANGGVVFTGARGDLAFTGAATRYFGPRFENVGNIRVNGSGVTLDFDKTGSLRDILSLSFTGGANAIRSREGGIFRDDFTIPVTDATLALETFNVGGVADRRAAAPLFALTNATLRIDENPYWETENLSRGITMNGSTIEVNYANAGFGPAVDGAGFNLSVLAGENRISGAMHAVTVSGTLSIDVADGASLTVSVPLKQAARAGSLIKTGEGTLALRASNAFRSGIVVREGVLVAGAQSRQALAAGEVTVEPGATLVLESLPAASITRLAVKAGGRLVLPGAVTTASYLIVDPLKASLDFADGARVYNEHDLSTPLAGSTTSDGYFMNTDGFLTWGAAGGTWTSDASVRPWLTSQGEAAGYEDGRSVQFVDRAAEEVGVAVAGAVRPGYASFANHATRYVFTKADDAAAILLDSLYTVGETSFEPSVRAVSKTVVTAGKATFADLAAGSVMVAPEGALNVTGTLSPLSKVRKIVFRATRFQGVASPFGQRYDGYQVNGLELLDGGSRLALPVGTKVTATGTFNGQTETKTMTIRELDESGYVADFAGDDLRALVDASAETGWGCKGAGNALVLGTPSVAITLELGAPVSMFAAYRLAGGDTPARSPSAWTVSVTEDSSAGETQVDAQALGAPAEGWWTSGAVSLDAASDVALSVAAGGALYLNGTLRGTVSLSDGARLAVTNAQSLTVASGLTLEGGVELDVGEAAPMGWTPVLKGAHLSPKDVYRFRLSRTDAAAKVVDGDLYVATANVVPGPYARTVSGDANWNTADWTAAGASLAGAWDAVATLPTGDATLTVSGETTLAVDTAVTLGTLRIVAAPGGSPLLRVTGTHALTASVIDFSGYSGTVVWEPDLAGASVVCGAGDVTLLRGDGDALTVPAGGVARLAGVFTSYANAPEGRIDFLGADRSFSTADLPSAGTLSFEGATVAGEFDNAALAWLVEEGDALVLDAAGATAPSTGSVDIRGGSLTVNPGAAWRFGENGRTRLTMTGGAFVCNANGTDLAGDSVAGDRNDRWQLLPRRDRRFRRRLRRAPERAQLLRRGGDARLGRGPRPRKGRRRGRRQPRRDPRRRGRRLRDRRDGPRPARRRPYAWRRHARGL